MKAENHDKLRDLGWKIKMDNTTQYFLLGQGSRIKTA